MSAIMALHEEVGPVRTTVSAIAERAGVERIAPIDVELDRVAAELEANWPRRNARRMTTIRHALEFSTRRSLDRLTGNTRRSAALVVGWIGR